MHDYYTSFDDRLHAGQPPPFSAWDEHPYEDDLCLRRRSVQGANVVLGTVVGSAAGAVLAMFPGLGLASRRDELIKLGAAIGGVIGLCRDAIPQRDSYD